MYKHHMLVSRGFVQQSQNSKEWSFQTDHRSGEKHQMRRYSVNGKIKKIDCLVADLRLKKNFSQILFGLQSFRYDNMSIDLMIKMRLVNVLIERLDLNLKDLTETHDKKLKRTIPADNIDNDDANDTSHEEEECDTPTLKKMKLDYFPITMNVRWSGKVEIGCLHIKNFEFFCYRKMRRFHHLQVEITIICFRAVHVVQPVCHHRVLQHELMVRIVKT